MGKRLLCFVISLVLILLICVGCSPSEKVEYPPYCEDVCGMLGQDLEAVINKLGLSIEDFTYENSSYWYKNTVKFCDYSFRMRITTYRTGDWDLVQGIGYLLEYPDDPEGAADAVINLREVMEKGNHQLVGSNPNGKRKPVLLEADQADLTKKFSEVGWISGVNWILSTDLDNIPQEIIATTAPTCISLRFWVNGPFEAEDAEADKKPANISLEYGLTADYIADNYN